ncbi:MAG: DoxX family membrane protein [Candidatus Eremiobacteraeota bacterium]|nr:DoxX family membrane protein [Candidatus Eremiobacteraeota bacterium]
MAAHGAQKLFGWFGGYGLAGTGGFMETLGWRPGQLFALGAGLGELLGGLLIVLGVGGPVGPALVVMVMIAAILAVHLPKGFWNSNGGYEVNSMYVALALALAFVGFGAYSVDRALGWWVLPDQGQIWIALAIGAALGVINNFIRRPAPTAVKAPTA